MSTAAHHKGQIYYLSFIYAFIKVLIFVVLCNICVICKTKQIIDVVYLKITIILRALESIVEKGTEANDMIFREKMNFID